MTGALSQLRGGFCQHRYSLKPLRVRDPGLKALLICDLPQISARTISLVSKMCLLKTPSFELGGDKMRLMSRGPRNMAPFPSPHLLGRGQKHSLLQWQSNGCFRESWPTRGANLEGSLWLKKIGIATHETLREVRPPLQHYTKSRKVCAAGRLPTRRTTASRERQARAEIAVGAGGTACKGDP